MNEFEILLDYINKHIQAKEQDHPLSILIPIPNSMYWNYGLYQNEQKRIEICEIFESKGYSCRVGLQVHWEYSIGMQAGFIELSKRVNFEYRLAEHYKKELKQGHN